MRVRMLVTVVLFLGLLETAPLEAVHGQAGTTENTMPQWEIAAGGKMAFDVASVKPDTSNKIGHAPVFPLIAETRTLATRHFFRRTLGL